MDEISSTGGEKHFFLLNAVENPDSNRSYIPRIVRFLFLISMRFVSPLENISKRNEIDREYEKTGLLWKRRFKDEMTMDREWHDSS